MSTALYCGLSASCPRCLLILLYAFRTAHNKAGSIGHEIVKDLLDSKIITVGLPVYNAMPYLPEALESILGQSVSNLEILAIVDGATDGSLAYLKSVRDRRLRIVVQENQGVTATLNRMLRECRTAWLVRQDADDVSHPKRIERLMAGIVENPNAGMFYSLANYHPRGRAVGRFRCSRGTPRELREIVRSGYLLAICHSTVALNVQKTLALGAYRIGLHNEDADLWWRMALKHDIQFIPEVLVGFRQNVASVSARNLAAQFVAGLYVQYLLLSHLWKLPPRSLGDIRANLESLLPRARFRAKERLRSFNMYLAEGQWGLAIRNLAKSMLASPMYILERFSDELFPSGRVANGISPALFLERKEALWL